MARLLVIENAGSSYRFIITIMSAIVALAAVVIIQLAGNRKSGIHIKFLFFFAAVSAGFFVSLSFESHETAWSGLSLERVTAVTGQALSDSRRISSGGFMLELSLDEVEDKRGASADAGGKAVLFFKADPQVFSGELLSVTTGLSASDGYRQIMTRQTSGKTSLLKDEAVLFGKPYENGLIRTGWASEISRVRAGIMKAVLNRCGSMAGGSGGMFAALFTGCRDGLSREEVRVFREAGCSHILALSGMHLGIISGIILLVLKPLPGRKPAFLASCLIITAYLFLTGFGISLVRAAVMYFIGGVAPAFYRKVKGLNVILSAFIILVIIEPASFYTLSFQLSFLAVAGIIIAAPLADRLMRPYFPRFISTALACSIAAQLFVTPVLVQTFGELYPVGIAAGIIIAPLVTVFIWTGIIYLATGAQAVSSAAGILYRLIFAVSEKASEVPAINTVGAEAQVFFVCGIIAAALLIYSIYRRMIDGISGKL